MRLLCQQSAEVPVYPASRSGVSQAASNAAWLRNRRSGASAKRTVLGYAHWVSVDWDGENLGELTRELGNWQKHTARD